MNDENQQSEDYFGAFGNNATQALAILMPVVDLALSAHETGDYQAFRNLMTDSLAARITPEGFQNAYKAIAPQLGPLISKRLVAAVNQAGNPRLLFVARYTNTSDDIVINITFANNAEAPLINDMWIE
ncbi:MAG: hypothetical protein CBB67_015160 [Alteromonadaceae bacterium TMED7]|nr:hypothetical protein [Alteromonadaceae bacterium]RPH16423.1 MAG: hypothetical protein CBB67_015160 [Alteromonadaceae bacterium TMED7]|tara:strand:- start:4738 stop:5121 length:384 start_codon:yes stop_codon:yes gene_type:complete